MGARETKKIVPFLKWAGGKRWFSASQKDAFPQNFNRYFEPFLGSGALFFCLLPPDAVLSDSNAELINTYTAIRDDWKTVSRLLHVHQDRHGKRHYYETRSKRFDDPTARAAQFIYLNRVCWNGLYRVNLRGEFNVPIGTKSCVIMDTDDFEGVSEVLQGHTIYDSDFESVIDCAAEGDLIFADPPYTVKHNVNGFVKYNEKLFSWDDQIRLRDALARAVSRGVHVVLTNANHRSIRSLYSDFGSLRKISRKSILAADSAKRVAVTELLIRSW